MEGFPPPAVCTLGLFGRYPGIADAREFMRGLSGLCCALQGPFNGDQLRTWASAAQLPLETEIWFQQV